MVNPFARWSTVAPGHAGVDFRMVEADGSGASGGRVQEVVPPATVRLPASLGVDVVELLGEGAGSKIYAVRGKGGEKYALKHVTNRSSSDRRFIQQAILEHEVASRLDHPILRRSMRLVKHRGLFQTREVFVLMELVEGIPMDRLERVPPLRVCRLCQQVAVGLGEMHKAGYVHADIKPNNVLVTVDDRVKIIDFGQSCRVGTVKQRIQGTPDFIAPEQVLRQAITPQTDVFNLGATMYWLLTKQHVPTLIPRGKPGLSFKTESTFSPPEELNPLVPPALSSLVMSCTQSDPAERPATMARVYERLSMAISQLSRRS